MAISVSFSFILIFFLSLLTFLPQLSLSTNITVSGVSESKDSSRLVHIGDSVIFKHEFHFDLYIFRNERAFNGCDFTQATLLSNPNAIYRWNPSRPGFFYFSFKNATRSSSSRSCEKLAIMVVAASPPPMVAPEPVSSGVVASSPAFPWPFQPHETASPSTSVPPGASSPMPVPSTVSSDKGVGKGKGMPFIYSNPAVPLPTGEVDSETIQPFLPTSDHRPQMMMGLQTIVLLALLSAIFLII